MKKTTKQHYVKYKPVLCFYSQSQQEENLINAHLIARFYDVMSLNKDNLSLLVVADDVIIVQKNSCQ